MIGILTIILSVLVVILAVIFLVIVIFNKTSHTIPLMLTCNSCISEIIYGSNMLSLAVFTLENDRKRRVFQDALCTFRGYLGYAGTPLFLYSFSLQAIYRFIIVVYPTRISWQSVRCQSMLICFFWIFSIIVPLPWFLTGTMIYNIYNQVCYLPFQLSIPLIYNLLLGYMIPIDITALTYFKLVRYVRQMSSRATSSAQSIFQARRELAMVQRIVTIISVLVILGLPYTIFMFMSFITHPPKYHFCIFIFLVL